MNILPRFTSHAASPSSRRALLALSLAAASASCADHQADGDPGAVVTPIADEPSLFDPAAPFARPRLCDERPKSDAVRDLFCGQLMSPVRSLRQLEAGLALSALPDEIDDEKAESLAIDPHALVDNVVYLAHSTALSGQLVSSINPRAILLGRETFLAYQRGVQQVEVVAVDRDSGRLNFYLVSFAQACNDEPAGCTPGDLYTQAVERDWTDLALRDDESLKNTPLDCRQCHQRARTEPALLMRELRGPWTHFFAPDQDDPYDPASGVTGRTLARDFRRAKGGEAYAGLPALLTRHTAGAVLQNRVGSDQPVNFESEPIDAELNQCELEGRPRRSARWDASYQAFKRGEQLALPHFEARPFDPEKIEALSDAYTRYRRGEIERDELPDLSDVFPADARVRAELGLQTEPGAAPAELLVQACGACHNDVLDQSLTRARFNIALGRMSRAELDLAIARIQLPRQHGRAMPPHGTRQLDPEGEHRLIAYLLRDARSRADDALLEQAAALGMAVDPYDELGL
jgi:hypothetical protein